MTKISLLVGAAALALPLSPLMAQDHHHMPGMAMPSPAPAPDNAQSAADPGPSAPADPTASIPEDDAHHGDHTGHDMAGMSAAEHAMMMGHSAHGGNAAWAPSSGTARQPGSGGGHHGLHVPLGDSWALMVHGAVSTQYSSFSGPRGDDKLYTLSHLMLDLGHDTPWGHISLRTISSLEALMRHDGYPSLFTVGEVAYGRQLVDRQHPHDLFGELAARVDINLGQDRLFAYGGLVAEPPIGPGTYLHRASAANNPEPPITHHWFDSTHASYGALTLGYSARKWQVEVGSFRGREPDEFRFNIERPRLDSWAVRLTWNPDPHWSAQVSTAYIRDVEQTHPGENEQRTTASIHYGDRHVAAMLGYSNKDRIGARALPAWLGEVNWNIGNRHSLFGRFERVTIDELFDNPADPRFDVPYRITKLQIGYGWHQPIGPVMLTLGGTGSLFLHPQALDGAYGRTPVGTTIFARLSIGH